MDYGSIIGGIISGLFTFLGVALTLRHQEKVRLRNEKLMDEKKNKDTFDSRPRFEITSHQPLKDRLEVKNVNKTDLDVFIAKIENVKNDDGRLWFDYDQKILTRSNWTSVVYLLQNIGKTEIDHIYISSGLPKNVAMFDAKNQEVDYFVKNGLLNYSVILEKFCKPGESIKLTINYLIEKVVVSNLGSAMIKIWMIDINGKYWAQPLFAPENKIYNSFRTSSGDLRTEAFIDEALKCFENPMLW